MDSDLGRGRGRGWGSYRGTPGRSGGRHYSAPSGQQSRRSDHGTGWSSLGKEQKFMYVEKGKGQSSSEPVSAPEKVNNRQNPKDGCASSETLGCNFSVIDISQNRGEDASETLKLCDKVGSSSITGTKTPYSDGKASDSDQTFDICPRKTTGVIKLNGTLFDTNRANRNESKRIVEQKDWKELRSGMVLLKNFISLNDQVKIVKKCRDLGIGPGGFYQPGYGDGAQLRLHMMCLGKNWDPESSSYGHHRPRDGAKPPLIPSEFFQFVKKSIEDSHSVIEKTMGTGKAENRLPWMTPNICIVNFYSTSGRLGLHQDRDESPESIKKGLPVVSFSIGDTAKFLFGDQRDVEKANTVDLESGDVLIFGGDARNVFHGVTSIKPNTAPKNLLERTDLRAGRLNLTFRQY